MIDKLEFILALARERHFGRAAEACGVTQPTLSAGVKQLEEQMGVLLVNRGSRFQSFTPEGDRVLNWARRIVGDTRTMRDEIDALRHGLSGQLRIAVIPTALAMVAEITTPYRELHPNVRFTILSRTSKSAPSEPPSKRPLPVPASTAVIPAGAPWSCDNPESPLPTVRSAVTTLAAAVNDSAKTLPSSNAPPFCE